MDRIPTIFTARAHERRQKCPGAASDIQHSIAIVDTCELDKQRRQLPTKPPHHLFVRHLEPMVSCKPPEKHWVTRAYQNRETNVKLEFSHQIELKSQNRSSHPPRRLPVAFRQQITLSFISIRVINNVQNLVCDEESWSVINPDFSGTAHCWSDCRGAAACEGLAYRRDGFKLVHCVTTRAHYAPSAFRGS